MKKDIHIPEVVGVDVAIVQEYNVEFEWNDWNAYIINNLAEPIEMVLIVSSGFEGDKMTSTMRHSIKAMPAKSFAKIELIQEELLQLTNQFSVTYFCGNSMFDKKFSFQKNAVNSKSLTEIPLLKLPGVLAK